ncbi:MAG: hypothetical protein ABWY22_12980 [Flavobacterium sp.]
MKNILVVIAVLTFISCKHDFVDKDLIAYNCYNENDTLIFQSSKAVADSFVIAKKEIKNYGWDENKGLYNPPTAIIYSQHLPYRQYSHHTTGDDNIRDEVTFMTIYKTNPNDAPREEIYFKDFNGTIEREKQRISGFANPWKEKIIYKVPLFDLSVARNPEDLIYVYWNDKLGIIGYQCKDGEYWRLVKKMSGPSEVTN